MIHVFNRSHYEDVLVVRVKSWSRRSAGARATTRSTTSSRCSRESARSILKFFLHISKDEQLDRFRERLEREDKHCKFSANDVRERRNWDAYQEAYEDALNPTSTPWAPWYVVPVGPQVVPQPRRGPDRLRHAGGDESTMARDRRGDRGLRARRTPCVRSGRSRACERPRFPVRSPSEQ